MTGRQESRETSSQFFVRPDGYSASCTAGHAVTGFGDFDGDDQCRVGLDTTPALLARRLAQFAYSPIRNADRSATEHASTADGGGLYAQYALANRFAAAAPAVVQRVGSALQG